MFVSCNDDRLPLENSREIVFQFELTGFIENYIIEVEVLPLEKIATAIRGGEYYGEEGGE